MFQSAKPREFAHEQHMCVTCTRSEDCTVKPESTVWRYVLASCQEFEPIETKVPEEIPNA